MFAAPRSNLQIVQAQVVPVRTIARSFSDPVPSDPPRLSNGKLIVLGASIGLIFLLGKLGKK